MVTQAGKKVAQKKANVRAAKVAGTAHHQAQSKSPTPTSATDWKKSAKQEGFALEVPSGKTALVKPVGMDAFLAQGMIPNSLRTIIMQSIKDKKTPSFESNLDDEKIADMFTLFDAVVVNSVIEPKVSPVPVETINRSPDTEHSEPWQEQVPIPMDERDEDYLYVDEVELMDKMFIFQFAVGGTRDLESFRNEYEQRLDALS